MRTPKGPWMRTHYSQAARTPRARHRVVGHIAARTGCLAGRVASACCRVAALLPSPPGHDTKKLYRDSVPVARCRTCRSASALCRRALLHRIAALLHRITTQKVVPNHDTNHCIATYPQWPSHVRQLSLA